RNPAAMRTPYVCSAKPWMLTRTWCMSAPASPEPDRESKKRDGDELRGGQAAPNTTIIVAPDFDHKAQEAEERHEPGEHFAVHALARPNVEIGDHENRQCADGLVELGRVNAERGRPRADEAGLDLRAPRHAATRKMRRPGQRAQLTVAAAVEPATHT